MRSDREKTTGIMGFVVSILLHGIFFAGCIALDYSDLSSKPQNEPTELGQPKEDITKS